MEVIQRKNDVIFGKSDLEQLHRIDNFPVFMGCVEHPLEDDLTADFIWDISKSSGVVQLRKLIPLPILYQGQHNSGLIGKIWQEHHLSFARFVHRFSPSSVLEIGGAHGILSQEYSKIADVPWVIAEPNPNPVPGCKATFLKGFIEELDVSSLTFDTIVHSHVFEHVYEPNSFVRRLSEVTLTGKMMLFSLPNLENMLKNDYTNTLNFEHTVFLTEPYIDYLLAKNGFEVVEKKYFMEDHSIFYAARRVADQPVLGNNLEDLYTYNKSLYLGFLKRLGLYISELKISMEKSPRPLYLFGAHIFSQYLLMSGLGQENFQGILDNDPKKQGKRLYGTNLSVSSPEVLRSQENATVILNAGIYNKEIRKDISENIHKNVVFL